MAVFIDTSAAVKLVSAERESEALRQWLADLKPDVVSSELLRTELMRALHRHPLTSSEQAAPILDTIAMVTPTSIDFAKAGDLDPPELRSLDALHLAVALGLGDDVDSMLTYDHRLADAAEAHGLTVIAPR